MHDDCAPEEQMVNGQDHDTIPIRQSTVDEVLRALQEATAEQKETREGVQASVANLSGELKGFVGEIRVWMVKTDSDIRELKGDHRQAMKSVTDLTLEAKETEIAEAKEAARTSKEIAGKANERILKFVGQVLAILFAATLGYFLKGQK